MDEKVMGEIMVLKKNLETVKRELKLTMDNDRKEN